MEDAMAIEQYLRSVLVGGIPKGVTEEDIKNLLTESGSVINFRLFNDALSHSILCEYGNQEMALRAFHILNNYNLKGTTLQVDIAASERSRAELERLQGLSTDPSDENDGTQEKAPEEICKAVASLPAEQMFELMKQMKVCIENNAQEARNLLLQNPQLAFALLQAQVIMRIVDPEVAMKILNRPITLASDQEEKSSETAGTIDSSRNDAVLSALAQGITSNMYAANSEGRVVSAMGDKDFRNLNMDSDMRLPIMAAVDKDMRQGNEDSDLRMLMNTGGRAVDPRFRNVNDPRVLIQDPRLLPVQDPRTTQTLDPRSAVDSRSLDPRLQQGQDPRLMLTHDPRILLSQDPRLLSQLGPQDPRTNQDPRAVTDPRLMQALNRSANDPEGPRPSIIDPRMVPRLEDPRKNQAMGISGLTVRLPMGSRMPTGMVPAFSTPRPPIALPPGNILGASEDQEKAALIMQVLQLSEEQIAALPPEQRQGILILKEQIARSQLTL